MHEWVLAKEVISAALKVAEEKNAKRVSEIRIKVGELQHADKATLEFAMKELAKGTKAENSKIVIEPERAVFRCNVCSHEWIFDYEKLGSEEDESVHLTPEAVHFHIRCPKCNSTNFQIKEGLEVILDSVRMESGT